MYRKMNRLIVTAVMATALFAGCGQGDGEKDFVLKQGQSDLEYVKEKGTLVVGITDFAPMDYKNGEQWTGFDYELAGKFAESLGVTMELEEIDWDKKTELLEKGSIDCIWNGMTMTEELQETISCSDPYLSNAQVVVMKSTEQEKYQSMEDAQHLLFAVESGSTGEAILKEKKYRYSVYDTQKEALESVSSKKTDATVIDVIMAEYYTGEDSEFDDLGFEVSLNDEKICVGFREDSDLTDQANEFLREVYENGMMNSLAQKYGIEHAVLE